MKIKVNKKEFIEKIEDLSEDLTDAIIVCTILKESEIQISKNLTAIMKNITFESDINTNLDESIASMNRAVEFIGWISEMAFDGEEIEE